MPSVGDAVAADEGDDGVDVAGPLVRPDLRLVASAAEGAEHLEAVGRPRGDDRARAQRPLVARRVAPAPTRRPPRPAVWWNESR